MLIDDANLSRSLMRSMKNDSSRGVSKQQSPLSFLLSKTNNLISAAHIPYAFFKLQVQTNIKYKIER